jgi:hypothetical protein
VQFSGSGDRDYGGIDAWYSAGKLIYKLVDEARLRSCKKERSADRPENCVQRVSLALENKERTGVEHNSRDWEERLTNDDCGGRSYIARRREGLRDDNRDLKGDAVSESC